MRVGHSHVDMTRKSQQLQQYTNLYNKLNDEAYNKILPELKKLTEGVFNDISANYEGSRTDFFQYAGTLNSKVQSVYKSLETLLNKIKGKIDTLSNEIAELQEKMEED